MDQLIAILNAAIETCDTAFTAVETEYNAAIQVAATGPDMALATENLHLTFEHFELIRNTMRQFLIIRGFLFAINNNAVIEEHNTDKPAPVGPVGDVSEEHNTAAPGETAEYNPAAPEETVEHNTAAPEETSGAQRLS